MGAFRSFVRSFFDDYVLRSSRRFLRFFFFIGPSTRILSRWHESTPSASPAHLRSRAHPPASLLNCMTT